MENVTGPSSWITNANMIPADRFRESITLTHRPIARLHQNSAFILMILLTTLYAIDIQAVSTRNHVPRN